MISFGSLGQFWSVQAGDPALRTLSKAIPAIIADEGLKSVYYAIVPLMPPFGKGKALNPLLAKACYTTGTGLILCKSLPYVNTFAGTDP